MDDLTRAAQKDVFADQVDDLTLQRILDQVNSDCYWGAKIASTLYVNSPFDFKLLKRVLEEAFPFTQDTPVQTYSVLYGVPVKVDPEKALPFEVVLRDKDDTVVAKAMLMTVDRSALDLQGFAISEPTWDNYVRFLFRSNWMSA